MTINGLIKTSLVDYPGHVCATLFLNGCNMRCPFCHNKDLVLENTAATEQISLESLTVFLKKRRGVLSGICISGGEPTISEDLQQLAHLIKSYGYLVKLDTNGLNPDVLADLLRLNLLDYVAMDIKNSPSHYAKTCGLPSGEQFLSKIETSVGLLQRSPVDYEFRTTVMKELHIRKDFMDIGLWLEGSNKYTLQTYIHREGQLTDFHFTPYSSDELKEFARDLSPYFKSIRINY